MQVVDLIFVFCMIIRLLKDKIIELSPIDCFFLNMYSKSFNSNLIVNLFNRLNKTEKRRCKSKVFCFFVRYAWLFCQEIYKVSHCIFNLLLAFKVDTTAGKLFK